MANNSNDENVQCNVFAFTQPILAEDGSGKYKLELYERDSNRFGGEPCQVCVGAINRLTPEQRQQLDLFIEQLKSNKK